MQCLCLAHLNDRPGFYKLWLKGSALSIFLGGGWGEVSIWGLILNVFLGCELCTVVYAIWGGNASDVLFLFGFCNSGGLKISLGFFLVG